MEKLLPDQLKELWRSVERRELLTEDFTREQERLLAGYRTTWAEALALEGHPDLEASIVDELGRYMKCADPAAIRLRCRRAVDALAHEWRDKVDPADRKSIENFYNNSDGEIYELMWWHTLAEDISPLSYVTALEFAAREGCRSCLDFGAGVGSGSILFARRGFDVGLADISSPLLNFSRWRFESRNLPAEFFDLKTRALPRQAFDMITAMDVFEHLADPVEAVETLSGVLTPGGFLFGRFHAEADEDRPLHVVRDFAPCLGKLRDLGFVQVWQDDWLWGHQVFQKRVV
ncbi:MAG TPA: class I SAM-dependent methyltransferase [Candidatus Binatia bacterium]|jgi:SAM-dependent methyltransferase